MGRTLERLFNGDRGFLRYYMRVQGVLPDAVPVYPKRLSGDPEAERAAAGTVVGETPGPGRDAAVGRRRDEPARHAAPGDLGAPAGRAA